MTPEEFLINKQAYSMAAHKLLSGWMQEYADQKTESLMKENSRLIKKNADLVIKLDASDESIKFTVQLAADKDKVITNLKFKLLEQDRKIISLEESIEEKIVNTDKMVQAVRKVHVSPCYACNNEVTELYESLLQFDNNNRKGVCNE